LSELLSLCDVFHINLDATFKYETPALTMPFFIQSTFALSIADNLAQIPNKKKDMSNPNCPLFL